MKNLEASKAMGSIFDRQSVRWTLLTISGILALALALELAAIML
jgi:hypothetical protein